jgi:hypothetical protein
MRNHAFSLRTCNEGSAACDDHLQSRYESFHRNDSRQRQEHFRVNADDER